MSPAKKMTSHFFNIWYYRKNKVRLVMDAPYVGDVDNFPAAYLDEDSMYASQYILILDETMLSARKCNAFHYSLRSMMTIECNFIYSMPDWCFFHENISLHAALVWDTTPHIGSKVSGILFSH